MGELASQCGRASRQRKGWWEVSSGPGLRPLDVSPNPSQDHPKGLQTTPYAPGARLTQQLPASGRLAVSGTSSLRTTCSWHPELSAVFVV